MTTFKIKSLNTYDSFDELKEEYQKILLEYIEKYSYSEEDILNESLFRIAEWDIYHDDEKDTTTILDITWDYNENMMEDIIIIHNDIIIGNIEDNELVVLVDSLPLNMENFIVVRDIVL